MSKLVDQVWRKQDEFLKQFDTIKIPRGGVDKHGVDALEWLFNKVKKRGIVAAEVGCWTGTSAVVLGNLAKKCKGTLHCIDSFEGSQDSNLTCAKYVNIKNILTEVIKEHELENTIKISCADSKWGISASANKFDFVFIDADHRYEYVKRDIQVWLKSVVPGGILCGHDCEYLIKGYDDLFKQTELVDYTQCHTGVIRAVYEVFGDKANLTEKGYIWWVKKDK